jgi:hypothetical protein
MASLGTAKAHDAAPLLARELLNEYPLIREWARRSLVSILGHCDVDLSAADPTIAREAAACVGAPIPPRPATPTDEDPED